MTRFVRANIERGYPQFVVVSTGTVVGWCDVLPNRPSRSIPTAGRWALVYCIALHTSLGFEVEGRHRNAVRIEGQYENLYSMALLKD